MEQHPAQVANSECESLEHRTQLLKAELERRIALPRDHWDEWRPGAVVDEYRADRVKNR